MIVLAHVSDVHIDGSERNTARTRRVMAYVDGLDVAAVVVTGDIADNGAEEEYAIARAELKTRHPTVICPGNHDDRTAFRKVLLDGADDAGAINQVIRVPGASIVLCDSSIPGRPDGLLDEPTLTWLDATLAAEPGPVFVGMHHPPVALGVPYVDGIGLGEPARLAALLGKYPQVVAVLVGHAHTGAATTFAGRPLLVAPGVVSTALSPFEAGERPPIDYELPPALAFHILSGGRVTTHYRALP